MENKATRLRKIMKNAIKERDAMTAAKNQANINKCIKCIDKVMTATAKRCHNEVCIAFMPEGSYLNNRKMTADKMYLVNACHIKGSVFERENEEDKLCIPRRMCQYIGQFALAKDVYKKLKDENLKVEWYTQDGKKRDDFSIESEYRIFDTEVFFLLISW